jgi:carbon storage regulator
MLVLSRKVGERIVVNNDIRITVVRVTGGGVRLGIEAPDGTPVVREELLLQQIAAQNASAAASEKQVADGA